MRTSRELVRVPPIANVTVLCHASTTPGCSLPCWGRIRRNVQALGKFGPVSLSRSGEQRSGRAMWRPVPCPDGRSIAGHCRAAARADQTLSHPCAVCAEVEAVTDARPCWFVKTIRTGPYSEFHSLRTPVFSLRLGVRFFSISRKGAKRRHEYAKEPRTSTSWHDAK